MILKENYLFKAGEDFFLYNVEKMNAYKINHALYKAIIKLKKYENDSLPNINVDLKNALNNLKMLKYEENNDDNKKNLIVQNNNDIAVSHISLNVIQACNLKCVYCYAVNGEYGNKGFMSNVTAFKSIDYLIKESKSNTELLITFFGGEPLMNFSLIKEIVNYAEGKSKENKKKFFYSITTNGTLLNEEITDFLNKNKFSIVISYDGDIDMQKKNRPFKNMNGNYENHLNRIRTFLSTRNGDATARVTVTKYNADLRKVRNALKNIGFKRILIEEAVTPNNNEFVLSSRQRREILNDLERQGYLCLSEIKNREKITYRNFAFLIQRLQIRKKRKFFCGIERSLIGISNDGKIYPCHRFVGLERFLQGDIYKGYYSSVTKNIIDNQGVLNQHCKSCWARDFCGGGCLYDNLVIAGNLYTPNKKWCIKLKTMVKLCIIIYSKLNKEDLKYLSQFKI